MYSVVYFEISGRCNARCPWCATGRKRLEGKEVGGDIKPDKFRDAIRYMKKNGFIGSATVIKLFNWGEPLLNPDYKEIVEILNEEQLAWGLSTNASIRRFFDEPDFLRNLKQILISMPGFSQRAYDKIHGFNFETIKNNIIEMVGNYKQCGFAGDVSLSYHLYQFNMNDAQQLFAFCGEHGFKINAGLAYINDWEEYRRYLRDEMSRERLKLASQSLFLSHLDLKLEELKKLGACRCPQFDMLNIDEDCNVVTCCLVDRDHPDYSIGSLFDLSVEDVKQKKRQQNICKECHDLGIWYLIQNPVSPISAFTLQ